ncbi:cob(I)yrinic acid a,c-diamide adenosyltransferase [Niveispirillum sp. KHB5.9]|uniref:cob(I)yrinic acid a,c-diamide adenosyltransferase n=1 Tax=Niveispirillum sp. KHB5.9 TaxID=3400269 RepID=UPI003A83736B
MDPVVTPEEAERHKAKMQKRKALMDRRIAERQNEKGLLMVHTGPGKGKSTAAIGLMVRAAGHGFRVGFIQFIKGAWATGEQVALERFEDLIEHHAMGEGFTWETQDKERDIRAARRAWDKACQMMADPRYRLVVLDEMNIALRYNYLPVEEVVATLVSRRPDLHVLVTGRNANPMLMEAADLVTEFQAVKHPFSAGIRSQAGIEF